jgi:DNA-binding PadR family transcriptional regulator
MKDDVDMKDNADRFLPLSPAALHVLLALAGGELHGYGIMLETGRQSDGQYKLGPGTLYDNLRKLLAQGIVEETRKQASNEDSRRRYYRLTGLGRRVLSAEVARLECVVRKARSVVQAPRTRRA